MTETTPALKALDDTLTKLTEAAASGQKCNGDVAIYTYDWRKDSLYLAAMRVKDKRSAGLLPQRRYR